MDRVVSHSAVICQCSQITCENNRTPLNKRFGDFHKDVFSSWPADPSFRMTVEDVIPIPGRGLRVIGQIENGMLAIRDEVRIQRQDSTRKAVVIAIDSIHPFQKEVQHAEKGESIGALLRGVDWDDFQPGDILTGFESDQS